MTNPIITATGAYLPARLVKNADLPPQLETSDEWIVTRTGIHQRHFAAAGENTSHLAANAAKQALANAGRKPEEIDLIVLATTTPDETMPATAAAVQDMIGAKHAVAFDVQAACAGFVYALSIADNFIRTGAVKRALVIGAEVFSRVLDWTDRSTCVLFGDGAGAAVVEASEEKGRGVQAVRLHTDGSLRHLIRTDGGVASTQSAGLFRMDGKEVFRHAVPLMAGVTEEALAACGRTVADLDWLVPHQANQRILSAVAKKLEISEEKVISAVGIHANTSAASVPLALHHGITGGKIKKNNLVALTALGAGLAWGSAIVVW
ncbi:MAG: ketoacyl-ACP synthase III [Alphaproteobacteria bacterium]|nr:ketoacyl-ACP synthase III [Alphaproteobacteria bacterium]